jgi:ribose 1,5-bisphosphokinase PhnN
VTTNQVLLGVGLIVALAVGSQVLASRLRRRGRDHLQRVRPRPPGCLHYGFVTQHYDVIIVGSGAGGGTLALTAMANAIRVGEHRLGRMS